MKLFLVLYIGASFTPQAIVPISAADYAACVKVAGDTTAVYAARGDGAYVWKCEERGPRDMIWVLHPEWRK